MSSTNDGMAASTRKMRGASSSAGTTTTTLDASSTGTAYHDTAASGHPAGVVVVYERGVRYAKLLAALALLALVATAIGFATRRPFPSDRTPEGAYLRIALSLDEGRIRDMFPYLETEAQWASYTIRDARAKAYALIRASYPKGQGDDLLEAYEPLAQAPDGADAFAWLAAHKGFVTQLRRDLSGVAKVDVEGSARAS